MNFDKSFRPDSPKVAGGQDVSSLGTIEPFAHGIQEFMSLRAGQSFNNGLYRMHNVCDIRKWTRIVGEIFPNHMKRITCFAYDWLGRHFALDNAREVEGEWLVLMLEPGTGQTYEIPTSFLDFHNSELVEYKDDALAAGFFEQWLAAGGVAPSHHECIGYQVPLFLGGDDEVQNLELSDLDVYWSVCGQLLDKIRNLPDGTSIGDISLE